MSCNLRQQASSSNGVVDIEHQLPVPTIRPSEASLEYGHLQQRSTEPEESPSKLIAGAEPPLSVPENWNSSRINVYRTLACFWCFAILGANDAAYGALIPYIEAWYKLNYTTVALVFLAPLIGYLSAAFLNNSIHLRFGQRGLAIIACGCHIIAYTINSVHPPYPLLVISFMIAGIGNGLTDTSWNAWIGSMANATQVLGFLHAAYGAGAIWSPIVATTLVTKTHVPWYYFYYYVMIGCATCEFIMLVSAFWQADGAAFRAANVRMSGSQVGTMRESLLTREYGRVNLVCALFTLGYLGVEVILGGWIVTFMMRVRNGKPFSSGMVATGFWLGITVGRIILGFVTPRIGEKRAVVLSAFELDRPYHADSLAAQIYLSITIGLALMFWLVPGFYISAVAVSLQGFFLGPLIPAAVVATMRVLPRNLHVSSIGFAAAFGGCGAALLPLVVGAIAQAKGLQILPPFILALLGVIFIIWLFLPNYETPKK